jgi:hypothetical protein
MKSTLRQIPILLTVIACFGHAALHGAEALTPNLANIPKGLGWSGPAQATSRWVTGIKGKDALFTTGIVWLDGVNFTEGTIECDILGQSMPRGSNFPGVVFHGVDERTVDTVYFRPFNFRTELPESVVHAVQYTSAPQWPWQKLRAEKTGQYEKPIVPAPDGDAWFHAKIVVAGKKVSVFVNGAEKPSLEVETLNDRTGGKIGLTGGDAGVGGHFANFKITPAAAGGGTGKK